MSPSESESKPRKRKLFDVVPGKHRPKLVRNGAIFTVVALLFVYEIYTKPPIPLLTSSGTTLKADFKYAADVVPGQSPVRVDGVQVGQVTGQSYLPGRQGVQVTMELMPGMVKVKQDATASLRWRTLLGQNYYVDLTPGSPSAPPLSGAIPETATSSQVELDQTIQPLNGEGRGSLAQMFTGLNKGFSDPTAVHSTLQATAPAFHNLAAGLPGVRGTQPGKDLPALISSANQWISKVNTDENALAGVVDNGSTALGAVSSNATDFGAIFQDAPDALTQTQLTTARLRKTIAILNPIAQKLEPGATRIAPAATEAIGAAEDARPVLTALKPTLAAIRPSVVNLAHTAHVGIPVVNSLNTTLARVRTTYIPFLNATDSGTNLKNYEDIGPTTASVASILGYGDSTGSMAGFEAGAGEGGISGTLPCQAYLTNPAYSLTQKVDCEAVQDLFEEIYTGHVSSIPDTNTGGVTNALVQKALGKVASHG